MENSTSEKEGLEILRQDAEQSAEWIKSAAVSTEQARRSMDRLDTLERNKPTAGQVARYGTIGALGGAAAGAVGNAIEHGSALKGATPKAKALNLASSAVKGAIGGGALPLLRSHSDRRAEMGTLRSFMNQDKVAAAWMHSRAEHILAKNPSMPKGEAFAIATQQSHATGHTPKGYGTSEGKATAKAKYDTPKDDEQRANPGGLDSPKLAALGAAPLWRQQAGFTPPGMMTAAQRLKKSMSMGVVDPNKGLKPLNIKVGSVLVEIAKQAGLVSNMVQRVPQAIHAAPAMAKNLMTAPNEHFGHLNEVAGLGVLALPGLDTLQAKARARLAGDRSEHGAEKRQFMGEGAHAALDVGGLGMLAAPALAKLKHAFASSAYGGNTAQNGPGMKSHSQLPPFKVPPIEVKTSSALKRVGELVTGSKASRIRDAAARHTGKSARKLRGMARVEEGKVGKTQGALVGTAALGAASDAKGLHDRIKEGGAISRAKELVTGSRVKTLESAATKHMRNAVGKAGDAVRPQFVAKMLERAPDFKTHPLGQVAHKHLTEKVFKLHSSAARENKAMSKIQDLADKEDLKVFATRAGIGGGLYAGGIVGASKLRTKKKEAGVGVGAGMTTSQYSGPLSFGPFKMTSGIPPFRRPNMTKNDESLEGAAWQTGGNKEAAALLEGFEAGLKEASTAGTGAMGAAGKLSTSQRVGAPKTTGFAGPSIADIAKPKGFGMPMPGAQKNQI